MNKTVKRTMVATGGVVGILMTIGAVTDALTTDYSEMTCDQLTVETLRMTGVDATEPFDLEKARAINAERERQHCDNPFFHSQN